MNRWLFVVPASVALGALLSWAHVPAAWILGAIIASGAAALIGKRELEVNDIFFKFARGIIGVMAALPLVGIPPADPVSYTHLTLPTIAAECRSRWSPCH